jgi:MgtC family
VGDHLLDRLFHRFGIYPLNLTVPRQTSMDTLLNLGLALALGLLVGVERGWQEREAAEGNRLAGIRTFGLISLLGGLWELLGRGSEEILLGTAFLAFAVLMALPKRAPATITA